MDLWQILTIVFAILAGFFGIYWGKAKSAIKEIGVLFNMVSEALQDDTLTQAELTAVVAQLKKILDVFRKNGTVDSTAKNTLVKLLKKK